MSPTESIPSFDLIVSLDRSDRTVSLALLEVGSGRFLAEEDLDVSPEAMDAWWRTLCQAHPGARIAVAFEQPAPNLIAFFAARAPAAIYALNPAATWAYRQSITVSGARTDESDARNQARFVCHQLGQLRAWSPPPAAVVELDRMTLTRRTLVDTRTALTNRLQATLKRYFPQALELMHPDIWRPINLAFLRKWPSAQKLQRVPLSRLRAFYDKQGSRSQLRWEERSERIRTLVPLAEATRADELEVEVMVDQIEALNAGILLHERAIAELFARQGEQAERIAALPGAGPILAPRIYSALARHMPACSTPQALAAALGIAPVTDQSGRMRKVYRRLRCDLYTRQSFVEWAKESWKHSQWAEAFVRQRLDKGQGFHAVIRALAYKWIRILWRCWTDNIAYDEALYIARLRTKGSTLVTP